jgi:hypothetical protein
MNKKLSIIMLLSCVGNVFSMDGGGAAGGGDQRPLTMRERLTKAGQASSKKMRDLGSTIYVSGAEFADSKKGVAAASLIAGAACTKGGYKVLELSKSQDALPIATKILESAKSGYAIVCQAGSDICSIIKSPSVSAQRFGATVKDGAAAFGTTVKDGAAAFGTTVKDKGLSITRATADFIAQHKVGACVAGGVLASAAVVAGGRYAYQKYNQGKASAAASRRQLENSTALGEFLLDFDSNVNGESVELQRSALTRAVELNNLPLVESLIAAGANANQKLSAGNEHEGRDALFFAANWGRPEIVKALLKAGANNFDDALSVAKGNINVKAAGADAAGEPVEYRTVISLLEAAKAKDATFAVVFTDTGFPAGR